MPLSRTKPKPAVPFPQREWAELDERNHGLSCLLTLQGVWHQLDSYSCPSNPVMHPATLLITV